MFDDSTQTKEMSNRVFKREGNVVYLQPPPLVGSDDDDEHDPSNPSCHGGVCSINFSPSKPKRPAA